MKNYDEALAVKFDSDAGDNLTLREYFTALLTELWVEGEGFSGKRPFGNSGWESDVYRPLIAGGFISGGLDPDGFVKDVGPEADKFVRALIKHMGRAA